MSLRGDSYSDDLLEVTLQLVPCIGRDTCKNETEIGAYLSGRRVQVLTTDSIMDIYDSQ